jgi:polygalacturonase
LLVSHCEEFVVYGVAIGNSAFWTLELVESRSILIESSVIAGDRRYPNNDGIDVIDSSEVLIRNTTISTGDDCIAIITHTAEPIRAVVGTNLTLSSTSAAIKLASYGINATGLISDVFFSLSTIYDTNRGICFDPREGSSSIINVTFRDLSIETRFFSTAWWGVAEPISVTSMSGPEPMQPYQGVISNVLFENLSMTSENGIVMYGNATPIKEVVMTQMDLSIVKNSNYTNAAHDWRPSEGQQYVQAPVDGVWLDGVDDITMDSVVVRFVGEVQPYWGDCFNATNVLGRDIHAFNCTPPS